VRIVAVGAVDTGNMLGTVNSESLGLDGHVHVPAPYSLFVHEGTTSSLGATRRTATSPAGRSSARPPTSSAPASWRGARRGGQLMPWQTSRTPSKPRSTRLSAATRLWVRCSARRRPSSTRSSLKAPRPVRRVPAAVGDRPADAALANAWEDFVYTVKAVTEGTASRHEPRSGEAIRNRVDQLLNDQALTLAAGSLMKCRRIARLKYPELLDGVVLWHVGSTYSIGVSS
jgi:hypothetical protein